MKEIEATKRYYNRKFTDWSTKKTDSFHHEKPFTKLVSLWAEKGTIVDIGCAHGIHVPLMLGIGRHLKYFGIDISKSFLKLAQRRYPQLTFAEGDIADRASLPKKKFDGFLAVAVLMHIPLSRWDEMYSNIETLVRPGAFGYIALPVAHPSKVQRDDDTRHFTILNEDEQRQYLKSRGWKIKHTGVLDGFTTEAVWRWYIVQLP